MTWLLAAAVVMNHLADWFLGTGSGPGGIDFGWITDSGLLAIWAFGHCDTMDGPVISAARKALDTRNVNLVLPWIPAADEQQIRSVFDHAIAVRKLDPVAKELADQFFFETLVRIHRAGEGAPFAGLKPAGRDVAAVIPAADRAIEDGSIDRVLKLLTDAVRDGLHKRFHAVQHRKDFDTNDVRAGREFVQAYVPYVHYVEGLWQIANSAVDEHAAAHAEHVH